jgi:hypothetical protein
MVRFAHAAKRGAPALLALALSCHAASAATLVKIKNSGFSDVRIAFDGGQPMTIAAGGTAQTTLDPGNHSADCHFDGTYDGCNLATSFTLADVKDLSLTLRPTLTLQHAVAMAQQGMLRTETQRDGAWATNTLELQGSAADCADYSVGKLGAVSTRLRSRVTIDKINVATRSFCGEQRSVIGTEIGGAPAYLDPRFVVFRDGSGRQILVTQ